jgi:hypothetical protein
LYTRVPTAIFTAVSLVLPCLAPAQQQPLVQQAQTAQTAEGLKIVVIEGENGRNDIRTKTAAPIVVEIRDDADKPVPNAEVVFQLPWSGPGGVFYDWLRVQTVRAGTDGRAIAKGFTPNDEEGRFNIKVMATSGNKSAAGVIAQSNIRGAGPASSKGNGNGRKGLWTTIGIIGAGALAGGIYAGTRNGNGSAAAANPIVIAPGTITVGGPR